MTFCQSKSFLLVTDVIPKADDLSLFYCQQEESRNVDEIHSSGETSNLNGSSLDQRPDFATPVKASPPQNHDVKSVSGGKRKHPDPSAAVHGSPSVKCAKDSLLGDSLVSPLIRQLSLNNV